MKIIEQRTLGKATLFFLLWLVFAAGNSLLPVGLADVPAWLATRTGFFVLGYIMAALFFSRSLALLALTHITVIRLGLIVCSLLLFLCYLGQPYSGKTLSFALVQSLILISGAALLGTALSSAVRRPGELFPLALTAAAADVISVLRGPTRVIGEQLTLYYGGDMQGPVPFVDLFLCKIGTLEGSIQPLFGVSDWILIVLLSTAVLRLEQQGLLAAQLPQKNCAARSTFFVCGLGLCTALLCALILNTYIPALFFISLFYIAFLFICCNLRQALSIRDMAYSLIFPLLVGGSIFIIAV